MMVSSPVQSSELVRPQAKTGMAREAGRAVSWFLVNRITVSDTLFRVMKRDCYRTT